jgi:hypothetical protein
MRNQRLRSLPYNRIDDLVEALRLDFAPMPFGLV